MSGNGSELEEKLRIIRGESKEYFGKGYRIQVLNEIKENIDEKVYKELKSIIYEKHVEEKVNFNIERNGSDITFTCQVCGQKCSCNVKYINKENVESIVFTKDIYCACGNKVREIKTGAFVSKHKPEYAYYPPVISSPFRKAKRRTSCSSIRYTIYDTTYTDEYENSSFSEAEISEDESNIDTTYDTDDSDDDSSDD